MTQSAMPAPMAQIEPNTIEFETLPLVKPTGFREYDARWWFGHPSSDKAPEINLLGVQALGLGLGTVIQELGAEPRIAVGHDFRSYSLSIKQALTVGLMQAGCEVHDIGLALSPTAYFAQFDLDLPAVAMVTASHNDNGWTGVKMGCQRPLTFGPVEMGLLRDTVLAGKGVARPGGSYRRAEGVRERYIADLAKEGPLSRPIKVVCACGNGTPGAFAPAALRAIGADVIAVDDALDWTFPRYNPNPETAHMLGHMAEVMRAHGAELAVGFDGDGDRLGVVDNEGQPIHADIIGLMIARDLARLHPGAKFVVDVKSTGLFAVDPELERLGVSTDYYKTGHSYIKRRVTELGALAGFEKSGHFFFKEPVGRGYDDGIVSAIAVLRMLDRAGSGATMADLRRALPPAFGSLPRSPYASDEEKYDVVDAMVAEYKAAREAGETVAGKTIADIIDVNGVRFVLEGGAWGLVRASSNEPKLVLVAESYESDAETNAIFADIEARLAKHPAVDLTRHAGH